MDRSNLSSSTRRKQRVFISYAHEDIGHADRLFADLSRLGASPWLDKRSLLPGVDWADAIEDAIREADFFVALLSSHSVAKRGYVQKEVKKALDVLEEFPPKRIYLIPVRLTNCSPQHRRLKDLHWVDLFPDWDVGVRRIASAIGLERPFEEGGNVAAYLSKIQSDLIEIDNVVGHSDFLKHMYPLLLRVYELHLQGRYMSKMEAFRYIPFKHMRTCQKYMALGFQEGFFEFETSARDARKVLVKPGPELIQFVERKIPSRVGDISHQAHDDRLEG